ncbi:hypothetical protein SynNOUM97013_01631 [Synechococcus sp. NOUM97013]|nr:hypothetical protein SynNOUM97013_01631 [Synechococcus sp. NOUM97013]
MFFVIYQSQPFLACDFIPRRRKVVCNISAGHHIASIARINNLIHLTAYAWQDRNDSSNQRQESSD